MPIITGRLMEALAYVAVVNAYYYGEVKGGVNRITEWQRKR